MFAGSSRIQCAPPVQDTAQIRRQAEQSNYFFIHFSFRGRLSGLNYCLVTLSIGEYDDYNKMIDLEAQDCNEALCNIISRFSRKRDAILYQYDHLFTPIFIMRESVTRQMTALILPRSSPTQRPTEDIQMKHGNFRLYQLNESYTTINYPTGVLQGRGEPPHHVSEAEHATPAFRLNGPHYRWML